MLWPTCPTWFLGVVIDLMNCLGARPVLQTTRPHGRKLPSANVTPFSFTSEFREVDCQVSYQDMIAIYLFLFIY